jgi:2-C-methyl-D-erythritol 4-phosphate cytidylyltransferase
VGTTWAIVVAAGRGDRFGTPKQFLDLRGTRVIDRAIAGARAACDAVVVVVPAGVAWDGPPVDEVAIGGATRSESVRAGLRAVPRDAEIVVVHDAARPLASPALFREVIAATRAGVDGAIPAVPVVDTVKRVTGRRVCETLTRDELVAVQTPQAFRAAALRAAHEGAPDASDDAALVEQRGGVVTVVDGEAGNLKITSPLDMVVAGALLDAEARDRSR